MRGGAYSFFLLVSRFWPFNKDVDSDVSGNLPFMNRWSFLQTSTVSHSFDDWIPRWPGGFSIISMGCPTAFQSWAADATSQMFFLVRIDQHFLQLQRFIGKSCNISFIESSDQSLDLLTSGNIPVQQHTHIEKVEELGTDLVCFQIAISCLGLVFLSDCDFLFRLGKPCEASYPTCYLYVFCFKTSWPCHVPSHDHVSHYFPLLGCFTRWPLARVSGQRVTSDPSGQPQALCKWTFPVKKNNPDAATQKKDLHHKSYPARELTYTTLGKGRKHLQKCPFAGIC